MSSSTASNDQRESCSLAKPSALACLACRRKHLKCDGAMPICGRCSKTRTECYYTPSRRGCRSSYKSQGRAQFQPTAPPDNETLASCLPRGFSLDRAIPTPGNIQYGMPEALSPASIDRSDIISLDQAVTNRNNFSFTENPLLSSNAQLIDLYYAYFNDAHPILPPSHLLGRLDPISSCLEMVMKYIGSHFTSGVSSESYKRLALSAIETAEPHWQKVQALLLFSIALHGCNEREEAADTFTTAVNLAFELRINRREYVEMLSGRDAVKQESIRRTWWGLYVVDAMMAAFDRTSCKIENDTSDIQFPVDDMSYSTGVYLAEPPTSSQFDNRIFADEEIEFSSFCYTIDAARILKRTLNLGFTLDDYTREAVESIGANISSWLHHLPETKSHIIDTNSSVDEVLFLGYMLIHCTSIYLHLPRSSLLVSPAANASIACAQRCSYLPPTSTPFVHATKSIQAANGIAALASLASSSIKKHTPFFICGLVLSAVVQLSACSVKASKSLEPRRDRVALIIGELKSLNGTWEISRRVMKHIKIVAREVLEIGVQPPNCTWNGDTGPDVTALVSNEAWLGDVSIE